MKIEKAGRKWVVQGPNQGLITLMKVFPLSVKL